MPQQLKKLLRDFAPPAARLCSPHSFFITFEGIEGSGKSTLIEALAAYYRAQAIEVLTLREPGGTEFGERLRQAILEAKHPLAALAEAHLFAASRAQLLTEKILPYLKLGRRMVFLDRYLDSSLAYQGHARGLSFETILQLHQHAPLNLLPHLTFYLKIPARTSLLRQQQRGRDKDYFEREKHSFTRKLIQGHERLAKLFPQRIVTLDAQATPSEVFAQAQAVLQDFLKNKTKNKRRP